MFKKECFSLVLLGLLTVTNSSMALENLVLDGVLNEWSNFERVGSDSNDVLVPNSKADFLDIWVSSNSESLQIAYQNDGPIDDIWWPWQVYIDVDRNGLTGFNAENDVGAEYLLQGGQLLRYTGNGSNWSWQSVRNNVGVKREEFAEFQLGLDELGDPASMNLLFKASNSPFTGSYDSSGVDTFPRVGVGSIRINTDSITAERSNALTPQMDGYISEWFDMTSFGYDGNDVDIEGSQADILRAWMANDDQYLYLAYENDGPINLDTWWPWQAYFDTDSDSETGFKVDGIGADYILQGSSLSRYSGKGDDWTWEFITNARRTSIDTRAELRISRSAIGNPNKFKLQFKARNSPFINSFDPAAIDKLPDTGAYSYRMARVGGPIISNALSPVIDGDLSDWLNTTSFGFDENDIFSMRTQADWLEAWMAHDNDNLYLAYTNDGPINFGTWWPWQVYLDTDNDPLTGFMFGGIGADFILQGQNLSRYTGSGINWSWESREMVEYASGDNGNQVEMKLPRNAFGDIKDIKIRMVARNEAFTGNYYTDEVDTYWDTDGHSVLSYRLGEVNEQLPANAATYRLTFEASWSNWDWDPSFFYWGSSRFTGLIGATHKPNVSLWSAGKLASDGIKQVAETGSKVALKSEISKLINQGSACAEISGDNIDFPNNSGTVTFTVQPECSLVSLISKLTPSPDWFVGSDSLNLVNNSQWRNTVVYKLRAYDSGTDSGLTFTGSNLVTSPPEKIQRAPRNEDYVGVFTFQRF